MPFLDGLTSPEEKYRAASARGLSKYPQLVQASPDAIRALLLCLLDSSASVRAAAIRTLRIARINGLDEALDDVTARETNPSVRAALASARRSLPRAEARSPAWVEGVRLWNEVLSHQDRARTLTRGELPSATGLNGGLGKALEAIRMRQQVSARLGEMLMGGGAHWQVAQRELEVRSSDGLMDALDALTVVAASGKHPVAESADAAIERLVARSASGDMEAAIQQVLKRRDWRSCGASEEPRRMTGLTGGGRVGTVASIVEPVQAALPSVEHYLVVLDEGCSVPVGTVLQVPGSSLSFGADSDRDVTFTRDSVSRRHADVQIRGQSAWIVDHSRNGTGLPNRVISNSAEELRTGDIVVIGRVQFLYRAGCGAPPVLVAKWKAECAALPSVMAIAAVRASAISDELTRALCFAEAIELWSRCLVALISSAIGYRPAEGVPGRPWSMGLWIDTLLRLADLRDVRPASGEAWELLRPILVGVGTPEMRGRLRRVVELRNEIAHRAVEAAVHAVEYESVFSNLCAELLRVSNPLGLADIVGLTKDGDRVVVTRHRGSGAADQVDIPAEGAPGFYGAWFDSRSTHLVSLHPWVKMTFTAGDPAPLLAIARAYYPEGVAGQFDVVTDSHAVRVRLRDVPAQEPETRIQPVPW